jgi:hypothetical protein
MEITFGSDPEFMLMDGRGQLQSAVEIIQGTPDNRISMNGHSFYHDNVLAECAIRPAKSKEAVLDSFRECFKLYAEMAKPYKLVVRASADYPDDQLRSLAAREAGCSRESCAYLLDFLPKQSHAIETSGFRSAGGHVHVGVTDSEVLPLFLAEETAHYVPKMFDVFMGIPSVFMDQDPTGKARRNLYGSAGSHRRTSYGCEYRTLSNFWLASPALVGLIYDLTAFVANFVAEKRYLEFWTENAEAIANYDAPEDCFQCHGYDVEKLRNAINSGDKRRARPFMTGLVAKYLPTTLMSAIKAASEPAKFDMYKEWGL